MIRYAILVSCFLMSGMVYGQQGNPAPCKEVQQVIIDTDSVKRKILYDFIRKCGREKMFTNDKGILHLYEYHNRNNNPCWALFARIDDDYKDNPPYQFSDLGGDIILIYKANSALIPQKNEGNKEVINACLEKIIGDRVYIRPTIKTRWTSDVLPFINRKRSSGNRREQTGGGGGIYVEFHKDNTYAISPMM